MPRKAFTENEIVLCTYIALFGRGLFIEKKITSLENRSESSIKMKIQNIAAMLDEEGIKRSQEVSALSGVTTGEEGRRTNWEIVSKLTNLSKEEFKQRCKGIIRSNQFVE